MYSQGEMWSRVLGLAPRLLANWIRHGRALDILVSHAPPRGVHDKADLAHQGFNAFRWLLSVFKPRYHFHGHIHVYDRKTPTLTRYKDTLVVNAYGYRTTHLHIPELNSQESKARSEGREERHG
jgi:Icc-related predicted phosphoesterase